MILACIAAAAMLYAAWRIEVVLSRFEVEPESTQRYKPTREESKQLSDTTVCEHCGGYHARKCPRVKRVVYAPSGDVQEISFWRTFDETGVIWPDELDLDEEPLRGEVVPAGVPFRAV